MNALLISWMCVSANVLMIWALVRSFDSFEKSSKPGVTIRPWLSLSLRHSISIDSHPRSLQNRYKTFHWTEQKQIKLWKQQTINLRWAYCVRIFFGFEISSHNETTDNFRRHYTMGIILIWLTWQLFKPCICSGECVFMMIVLFVKSQYKHSPVDQQFVSAKQLRMVLPNYLIEWQKYLCIVPWIQLQPTPTEFHFDLKKLCLPQRVRAQSTWRKMQDNQVKLSSSSIVLSIITQQTKWNQPHDCCDVADICKTM